MSIILAPSHDCHHGELVETFVADLERWLGRPLEWAAWSHRDSPNPHVHVVLRDPRADVTSRREFDRLERQIQDAAERSYGTIRERQRDFARERDRARGR